MFLTKGGSCVLYLWGGVGWFEGFWALTQSAATGPGYLWRDYAPHEIYGNEQVLFRLQCFGGVDGGIQGLCLHWWSFDP